MNMVESSPTSLIDAARLVLLEPDPFEKQILTDKFANIWREGGMVSVGETTRAFVQQPARSSLVTTLEPSKMPKMGKGGSLTSRQMILHSLTHIESVAVDLAWDAIARFGSTEMGYHLPHEFFDDFVTVAEDEARHFRLLAGRLKATGSYYGAFPTHEGLWRSAAATACSLPARLAVEHCVHEARGLDVLPSTIRKLRDGGDEESAAILEAVIYPEEVSHCAAGVRWLKHLHDKAHAAPSCATEEDLGYKLKDVSLDARGAAVGDTPASACIPSADKASHKNHSCCMNDASTLPSRVNCTGGQSISLNNVPDCNHGEGSSAEDCGADKDETISDTVEHGQHASWEASAREFSTVQEWFRFLVRRYFKGNTKPPFNDDARKRAGFTPDWYEPLVTDEGRMFRPAEP